MNNVKKIVPILDILFTISLFYCIFTFECVVNTTANKNIIIMTYIVSSRIL